MIYIKDDSGDVISLLSCSNQHNMDIILDDESSTTTLYDAIEGAVASRYGHPRFTIEFA